VEQARPANARLTNPPAHGTAPLDVRRYAVG
jgi:hypothetical protein